MQGPEPGKIVCVSYHENGIICFEVLISEYWTFIFKMFQNTTQPEFCFSEANSLLWDTSGTLVQWWIVDTFWSYAPLCFWVEL